MGRSGKTTAVRIMDAVLGFAYVAGMVHFLTRPGARNTHLFAALAIAAAGVAMAATRRERRRPSNDQFWLVLSGLGGGFWLFSLFRYVGLVRWPLSRAETLPHYAFLLLSHAVLALTILAAVLWALYLAMAPQPCPRAEDQGLTHAGGRPHFLAWGDWRKGFLRNKGGLVLTLVAAACWVWAALHVVRTPATATGNAFFLVIIAFAKACLTGATEEIGYRGVIQPAAVSRFGLTAGILFQAVVYTAFHMHLGPVFFGHGAFLGVVFALGLVFGIVTQLTAGIGWSGTTHVALNLVIEWNNLS